MANGSAGGAKATSRRSLDPDDFTDAQAIAAIERITRGNFRLLERLFLTSPAY